jgi:hypothetical protein
MRKRIWEIAPIWLLLVCAGCCFGPTVDTVPWWKGLPAMLIEPTSLEGMVWRDHLRAGHGRTAETSNCQTPPDAEWVEPEWLEEVPVPAITDDSLPSSAGSAGRDILFAPIDE